MKFKKSLLINKKVNPKIFLISLPILIIIVGLSSYFVYEKYEQDNSSKIAPTPVTPEIDNVFPKIEMKDFYQFIEFKDGQPLIGDKMIKEIIKSVITRLGSSDGDINYYLVKKSNTRVELFMKWVYQEKVFKKTYIISINTL